MRALLELDLQPLVQLRDDNAGVLDDCLYVLPVAFAVRAVAFGTALRGEEGLRGISDRVTVSSACSVPASASATRRHQRHQRDSNDKHRPRQHKPAVTAHAALPFWL